MTAVSQSPVVAGIKEKRVSRACITCRQRKTRCDLYSFGKPGEPPCTRCYEERLDCTLATSRRGGRRPRKRPDDAAGIAETGPTWQNTGLTNEQPGPGSAGDANTKDAPNGTGMFDINQQTPGVDDGSNATTSLRSNAIRLRHLRSTPGSHFSPSSSTGPSSGTPNRNARSTLPHKDNSGLPSSPGTDETTTATTSQNEFRPPMRVAHSADIDGDFASSDLLNPSDALNLLAQVADLDGEHSTGSDIRLSSQNTDRADGADTAMGPSSHQNVAHPASFYYPPISDGHLSLASASYLLSHYRENYHSFFPVADKRIFDGRDIESLARDEPHLLTSILTVASKDDPAWHRMHEACARHMDSLVSMLISRGSSAVGAVEALLILAEWAPQRHQSDDADDNGNSKSNSTAIIGRGEEDQGAWMQIGVAIRLAYLQGLEQTGLLPAHDDRDKSRPEKPRSLDFERKRIAWAACYMSDREVSIRLGKGFWSRGPGPSTVLNSDDFPTLRAQQAGSGDLGQLFQARLEMTQLFSNAHDILYSSTTHREQLFVGGEYVRYIDDFAAVLRKWKLVWGGLSLTPSVKAALILSYEFLRLYINAFAFQATISRAISRARQSPPQSRPAARPLFADIAGTPDARFIYESIDAANSLLNTLNDFIDPLSALRYMPLKYYLYVIYAAVFLFKARVAGALAGDSGISARRTINITIERLQKASLHPHSLGQRYARSLYLLWRKSADRAVAGRSEAATAAASMSGTAPAPAQNHARNGGGIVQHSYMMNRTDSGMDTGSTAAMDNAPVAASDVPATMGSATPVPPAAMPVRPASELDPLKNFSWRDLDGLGQFIGNDMNFLDVTLATPMSESDHGTAGLDTMTDAWQDIVWSGNDVIF